MALTSKKTDDNSKYTLEDLYADRRAEREASHSQELRQTVALEAIADELAAIRVHLTGKA